ncbi:uncharacterized protein MONBRDRAFT_44312 [Monosiga brevicollis MX1]|uniref:non-specific protein-tyrosine kinase n=1 Tax=Monosiga brevicollis TaxID=81824 RepID=A9UXP1_MONBE|nr:uncharacterized protein MONBRDRAFT_44312 [Monosiga brevicollis MX1]EDQ89876.1 predicted protein [Monosiga brevicollis MX1]|eukprot:XP_001745298.1 hypothetical protein [Monosiga brevicollis MX1]
MLTKRARGLRAMGRRNWKDRLFILSTEKLCYYESCVDESRLKGSLKVSDIVAVEDLGNDVFGRPYMMVVQSQDNNFLYCQAHGLNERNLWLEKLRHTVKNNSNLLGAVHKGRYDGRWLCCGNASVTCKGCQPAFDYRSAAAPLSTLNLPDIAKSPLPPVPGQAGGSTSAPAVAATTPAPASVTSPSPVAAPAATPTPAAATTPDAPSPASLPPGAAPALFEVQSLYDYDALEPTDLSLSKGERLVIVDQMEEHWWKARNNAGQEGYIPANYVRKLGLESEPWFMADTSKAMASALLNMCGQDGAFLVRESESTPGSYSLSVFYQGKLKHYKIKHDQDMYRVSERHTFASISELIEYHKHNGGGLVTRLRKPVQDANTPITAGLGHDRWELDAREIELGRELGSGNFGVVRAGVYKSNRPVAIKMMKEGSMSEDDFIAEAQVMMKFRHKNLVELLGVVTSVKPIYIVTELMSNGNLLDYLKKNQSMLQGKPQILHYMSVQVASGMAFLEDHGFIHRDLAARNCLVGDNNVVKVADFGLARFVIDDEYTASEGTKFPIKWASPEVYLYARFSTKSDVWSYGVLLWEIWSLGTTPYPQWTNAETVDRVGRGERMGRPSLASELIYDIMSMCWHQDPESRISFIEIVEKLEENADGYE